MSARDPREVRGTEVCWKLKVDQILEIASLGYLRVGEVTAIWGLKIDGFFGEIRGISQKVSFV